MLRDFLLKITLYYLREIAVSHFLTFVHHTWGTLCSQCLWMGRLWTRKNSAKTPRRIP